MAEEALSENVEQVLTEEARKRAAATPFPGPLADAFLHDAIQVDDHLFVRRIVASDWKILQALDSPICKQMLEFQKDEKLREPVPFTDEEEWEMCWQFTHSPKECRELMAKGRAAFREAAIEYGDTLTMPQSKLVIGAIGRQITNSWLTCIKYAPKDAATAAEKKT
jgi:hypothetical protein